EELAVVGKQPSCVAQGLDNLASVEGQLPELEEEALTGALRPDEHGEISELDRGPGDLGKVRDLQSSSRHGAHTLAQVERRAPLLAAQNQRTYSMSGSSAMSMARRSTPRAMPPDGGMPCARASRKSSAMGGPLSPWRRRQVSRSASKRRRCSMGSVSSS